MTGDLGNQVPRVRLGRARLPRLGREAERPCGSPVEAICFLAPRELCRPMATPSNARVELRVNRSVSRRGDRGRDASKGS